MAKSGTYAAQSDAKTTLTLTKAEIAFINATIELMREEESGRSESVTIAVDNAAAFLKALVKVAKAANKFVQKYGGWAYIATEVIDAIWGLSIESSAISREQADALQQFRTAAQRGISLDELIELRDRIETPVAEKSKSIRMSADV